MFKTLMFVLQLDIGVIYKDDYFDPIEKVRDTDWDATSSFKSALTISI